MRHSFHVRITSEELHGVAISPLLKVEHLNYTFYHVYMTMDRWRHFVFDHIFIRFDYSSALVNAFTYFIKICLYLLGSPLQRILSTQHLDYDIW